MKFLDPKLTIFEQVKWKCNGH